MIDIVAALGLIGLGFGAGFGAGIVMQEKLRRAEQAQWVKERAALMAKTVPEVYDTLVPVDPLPPPRTWTDAMEAEYERRQAIRFER